MILLTESAPIRALKTKNLAESCIISQWVFPKKIKCVFRYTPTNGFRWELNLSVRKQECVSSSLCSNTAASKGEKPQPPVEPASCERLCESEITNSKRPLSAIPSRPASKLVSKLSPCLIPLIFTSLFFLTEFLWFGEEEAAINHLLAGEVRENYSAERSSLEIKDYWQMDKRLQVSGLISGGTFRYRLFWAGVRLGKISYLLPASLVQVRKTRNPGFPSHKIIDWKSQQSKGTEEDSEKTRNRKQGKDSECCLSGSFPPSSFSLLWYVCC